MAQVKNLKQAQAALEKAVALKAEIDALKVEHGIEQKEADLAALKSSVVDWAVEKDVENIPLTNGHAQLRRDKYGGTWIGTKNDLLESDAPEGAVPLMAVIRRKFKDNDARIATWRAMTRRVVDPAKLTELVERGIFTLEEIEHSYYEKEKSPYIRIYVEE